MNIYGLFLQANFYMILLVTAISFSKYNCLLKCLSSRIKRSFNFCMGDIDYKIANDRFLQACCIYGIHDLSC